MVLEGFAVGEDVPDRDGHGMLDRDQGAKVPTPGGKAAVAALKKDPLVQISAIAAMPSAVGSRARGRPPLRGRPDERPHGRA